MEVKRRYKAKTMKIILCVLVLMGESVSDMTCVTVVLLNIKNGQALYHKISF